MRKRVLVGSFGVAAFALATACSDLVQPVPTSPAAGGQQSALTSLLIAPVQRSQALTEDVTWSFDVGPGGATSTNAAAGLAISVPMGAVSQPVTITVTALAANAVAYRFEPHGLQFNRSVYLTQDLRHTTLGILTGLTLSGAYFTTDTLELSNGLAAVTEIISAWTNPFSRTATFPIRHFSGYILASGRDGTTEE